jgi:hypothetical protein
VATVRSGSETFTVADLGAVSDAVAAVWTGAADRDWSVPAGTVAWSCLATADHAVDCVYAPAFFLASRRLDAYPDAGDDLRLGARATPARLVESLAIATRIVAGVVGTTPADTEAVLFGGPPATTGRTADFVPRAALELVLHAHDVARGLGVEFDPPAAACHRLREHTRPWPMWTGMWAALGFSQDAWADLLTASGRAARR